MNLIKAKYEITDAPVNPIGKIEREGRTCYKSQDKIGPGTADKFVKMLIARGHMAMIELGGTMTVKFTTDRGVANELARHRLASFAQESTRYCNYRGGVTFVVPPWIDVEQIAVSPSPVFTINHQEFGAATVSRDFVINGKWGHDPVFEKRRWELVWLRAALHAECDYENLIALGQRPEQARAVLPLCLATEIIVQANVREWRHIFNLRAHPAAHPQMQEIMRPLLAECIDRWPVLFQDLAPKEVEN